ncbi:MAG: DUF4435 domain-containing protein [Magnetococcales bacterium]|nr:DUF4435 domain-containing protein [Magnetococcales bacterium]
MNVIKNPPVDALRNAAKHTLYVEGSDPEAMDPTVLKALFNSAIQVKPLGPSHHVKSVANALHRHHPDYYFLIDRDYHSDDEVESSWRRFPDPDQSNLIIWRKREIENHFTDPNYLRKSEYYQSKANEPENTILKIANERLYLDAVNHVIATIREQQKKNWIECFTNPDSFRSPDGALQRLTDAVNQSARLSQISDSVAPNHLKDRFNQTVERFSGGCFPLQWNCGQWIDCLRGKPILSGIINTCFTVVDRHGMNLKGKEKINEVIKSLLRLPLNQQPNDFQQLHKLIMDRVNAP